MATQWSKKLSECKNHGNLIDCPSPDCNNEACEDCGACVKNCRKKALPKIKKIKKPKKKVEEPVVEPVVENICSPEFVSEEDMKNDVSEDVSEDASEDASEDVSEDASEDVSEIDIDILEAENKEFSQKIQDLKKKWKDNVLKIDAYKRSKGIKTKTKTKTKTKELLPVLDENGNLPKNDRHFSKRKTNFDPYLIPLEEELQKELPDHLPPVRGTRNGDIRRCYKDMGDNFDYDNEGVFSTLEEAYDFYVKHLKMENGWHKEEGKVKYAGICKMKRGYILKPQHKKGTMKWSKGRAEKDDGYEFFVTWELGQLVARSR